MSTQRVRLRDGWREFVGHRPWTHCATLTTRNGLRAGDLLQKFRDGFVRRIAYLAQTRIRWFAAVEQTCSGHDHLHVLLADTATLKVDQIQGCWSLGFSRILVVRDEDTPVAYMTKNVVSDKVKYDFSRTLPPHIRPPHLRLTSTSFGVHDGTKT